MDADDEYGDDDDFTEEDLRHMDEIESSALAGAVFFALSKCPILNSSFFFKGPSNQLPHLYRPP